MSQRKPEMLEDAHLVILSQRLGNFGNLRTLAYRGLALEHHQVESAINNHPSNIQTAAYEVMSTWSKNQEDRDEALNKLKTALEECDLGSLVSALEESEGCTMPSSSPAVGLLDSDIQRLSQRFSDAGLLRQFAYGGLKMKSHDIESSISNHPSDIQAAAHDVLRKWQLTQENQVKAQRNLLDALEVSSLRSFADELKEWKMKSNSSLPLSEERKSFTLMLYFNTI